MKGKDGEALYVYCVAPSSQEVSLGGIGLEGMPVYAIVHKDMGALVHDCCPQPYSSQDEELVKAWVLAHEGVVEAAWKRWGSVLPLSFNTIIQDGSGNASQALRGWLEAEYDHLKRKLDDLRGKEEYGVQIFWEPGKILARIEEASAEFRKLKEEIGSQPRGLAYMHRQKLERLLKREMEARAQELFRDFYGRIRPHADALRLEKSRGGPMLVNLSCLVTRERYPGLARELEEVSRMEGLSVRFTGPWPPYSFC